MVRGNALDVHEYQAKELLARFGVGVPRGGLAYSPEQASYRAREIGGERWVVKAQVHSEGRRQAGGVVLCNDEDSVYDAADRLFGRRLVTPDSGSAGKVVYRVYVERAIDIAHAYSLGIVLNRRSERAMVLAAAADGPGVGRLVSDRSRSVIRARIDPAIGMQAFQARRIAFGLGIEPGRVATVVGTILAAYRAFESLDATLVEIDPLAIATDGSVLALDAKMAFDDRALYRRPDIAELRDPSQEEALAARAADRGLHYVALDGAIGCIVNGRGLAMATVDLLRHSGAEAANLLDIGGAASADRVAKAVRLVMADRRVEVVLVNVFAGLNRCDWIAAGIVQACERAPIDCPFVVRLAGARVDEGRRILARSGLPIIRAGTLAEAAERAAQALAYRRGRSAP